MNKIIILVFISIAFTLQLSARELGQLGVNLDINGKQSFSNGTFSDDSEVKTGISLYGEGLSSTKFGPGDILFGFGIEYQIPRELKILNFDDHKRKFSYLPIYLAGKYVFLPTPIAPELIAQAGYNLPLSNHNYEDSTVNNLHVSGGLYWGLGLGIGIKPFVIQAMYKSGNSSFSWDGIDFNNYKTTSTNSQLSLQVGLRL